MRASQQAAYVVDASVVLKYYVPEELSDRAAGLLNSLAAREVALWAPSVLWLGGRTCLYSPLTTASSEPSRGRSMRESLSRCATSSHNAHPSAAV